MTKTSPTFGMSAELYDLLYRDKDYQREVDFLEQVFSAYGKPCSVLEVGCGTGNYTKLLSQRGYKVTGLDMSKEMTKLAKQKCNCPVHVGDVRDFSLGEQFDACIAMFAVLGYVTENSDVLRALNNVGAHLKKGGLFVFDVWNGLAVLRMLPQVRVKEAEDTERKVVRVATPKLDAFNHVCNVNFKYSILNKKEFKGDEFEENHLVRFYFPQELAFLLESCGFKLIKICPFPNFEGKVDESVWNMAVVAKRIK